MRLRTAPALPSGSRPLLTPGRVGAALGMLLVVGAVASAPAAATPPEVLAHEREASPVATYGGAVAWSSYDARTRRWRLKARVGGRVGTVPVASRPYAFDVDLGPGRGGGLSAVYSRCREARGPRGSAVAEYACDVFEYDFGKKRERRRRDLSRRGYDETLPSVWRGRVAFARRPTSRNGSFQPSRLFVATAGGRLRAVGGGSRGADDEVDQLGAAPTAVELRGHRLAFSWTLLSSPGSCEEDPKIGFTVTDELWLVDLGGARRRVAVGCQFDELSGFGSVSLTAGSLFATVHRRVQEPAGERIATRLARYSPRGAPEGEVDLTPSSSGFAVSQDGRDTWRFLDEPSGRVALVRSRLFE